MNATEYATRVRSRQAEDAEAATCREAGLAQVGPCESTFATDEVDLSDVGDINTLGLVELLLKNRRGLHQVLRRETAHAALLLRLLAISLTGFVLFGVTMSLVLTVANRWPSLTAIATLIDKPSNGLISFDAITSPWGKLGPWVNGQAFVLTGAYAFGLVAASGVALPSLYFYCLLAGVRMSMLEVVVHAVKAKSIAAVALVGILPIYVAAAMGVVIFRAGEYWLQFTIFLGLVLPFIAGFWGTASLYQGFSQLCDTMPADRAANRQCFLRRLVLSWSACYSAIMPVMIYSLWQVLSRAS
jgi:hypothetical protein